MKILEVLTKEQIEVLQKYHTTSPPKNTGYLYALNSKNFIEDFYGKDFIEKLKTPLSLKNFTFNIFNSTCYFNISCNNEFFIDKLMDEIEKDVYISYEGINRKVSKVNKIHNYDIQIYDLEHDDFNLETSKHFDFYITADLELEGLKENEIFFNLFANFTKTYSEYLAYLKLHEKYKI